MFTNLIASRIPGPLRLVRWISILGVLTMAPALRAQNATGSIVGIVRDASGNVIAGAQVHLLDVAKNQTTGVDPKIETGE